MDLFNVSFRVTVTTMKAGEKNISTSEIQTLPIMATTADEAISTLKRNLFYSFVSSNGLSFPTYEADGVRVQCFFGSLRLVVSYTEFFAQIFIGKGVI